MHKRDDSLATGRSSAFIRLRLMGLASVNSKSKVTLSK